MRRLDPEVDWDAWVRTIEEQAAAAARSQSATEGLRERVLAAMHRIVVDELPGTLSWQVGLANRLTAAALAAADATGEGEKR